MLGSGDYIASLRAVARLLPIVDPRHHPDVYHSTAADPPHSSTSTELQTALEIAQCPPRTLASETATETANVVDVCPYPPATWERRRTEIDGTIGEPAYLDEDSGAHYPPYPAPDYDYDRPRRPRRRDDDFEREGEFPPPPVLRDTTNPLHFR
jgi:hypothetical protein